jgi:hypothetical protein
MKTNKYIILLLTILAFTYACDDTGGDSAIDLIEVAVPNMTKTEGSEAILDLGRISNNEVITISFMAELAQGSPAKTDVVGVLATAAGPVYTAILDEDVTLPQVYSFTTDDLVAAFSEINSASELALGDVLSITTRYTLSNGLIIDIIDEDGSSGAGTNPQNNVLFNTFITYPVSCPSDLSGTYSVISNGDNTDGQPAAVNYAYDVTLTDIGGGSYEISDFSGGVYLFWYSIYGLAWEQPGTITDVCGTLSGTYSDAWGNSNPATGTVNPDGTLSIRWDNPWGDFSESVFTRK